MSLSYITAGTAGDAAAASRVSPFCSKQLKTQSALSFGDVSPLALTVNQRKGRGIGRRAGAAESSRIAFSFITCEWGCFFAIDKVKGIIFSRRFGDGRKAEAVYQQLDIKLCLVL